MNPPFGRHIELAVAIVLACWPGLAWSQSAANPGRQLAPGVLRTIDPDVRSGDTFSHHDLVELLNDYPDYEWAKQVRFEHDVWALEFSFKPLRFIEIDVPDEDRRPRRRLVWYMVYRVRNPSDHWVPFYPIFVLESRDVGKQYADRLVPAAGPIIQRRESPPARLLNTVEISGDLAPSDDEKDRAVWGVVTWYDIDPRTDRIAIYVQGLTNAYRWQEKTDGQDRLTRKALELHFWRPGDQFFEHESEIRFGMPGEVDYRWVYR